MAKAKEPAEYQTFGWQGMEMEVPSDWKIIGESGNSERGVFVAGSGMCSFEISWLRPNRRERRTTTTKSLINEMIERFQKTWKDIKILERSSSEICGHDMLYFRFTSADRGYGIVWFCDEDKKFFRGLFRYRPEHEKKPRELFKRIIDSFKCHPEGEQWRKWSLFGFSLKLPPDFEITNKNLLVGLLSLNFYREKARGIAVDKDEVYFQYWGPADVRFEDTYNDLEKWFSKYHAKDFWKRFKIKEKDSFELRDYEINGHEGKTFSVEIQRRTIVPETGRADGYLWFCYDTNRIYEVTLSSVVSKIPLIPLRNYWRNPEEMFSEIVKSISCH